MAQACRTDWQPGMEPKAGEHCRELGIRSASGPMSFGEVVNGWCGDRSFRDFFNNALAGSPFQAFRWELPPLTRDHMDRPLRVCPGQRHSVDCQT